MRWARGNDREGLYAMPEQGTHARDVATGPGERRRGVGITGPGQRAQVHPPPYAAAGRVPPLSMPSHLRGEDVPHGSAPEYLHRVDGARFPIQRISVHDKYVI